MVKNDVRQGGLSSITALQALVLCGLFLVAGSSQANSSEAMQWVQKMSRAMQELSYRGRFVYLHDDQLESMSILHVRDSQGIRERLVSLNGEAREILRDNANLTCIWPSSRQVVVDQSKQPDVSPLWIPEDVERLGKFYQFSLQGRDRVADLPAIVVSIQPRDQYRYARQVWIGEKNGLMLQSHLYDENGRPNEQVMFTDMALLTDEDQTAFSALPKIENGYALIRSHSDDSESQHPADYKWQLKTIPEGFWLETAFRKKMMNAPVFTQQMIFTDGMASVSIFIEKNDSQGLDGETSMGAVNAFGTRYGDYNITAIGEVPAVTVKEMALSMTYNRP